MTMVDDLNVEVKKIFRTGWTTKTMRDVPEPKDILMGNEAVEFDRATVLYADLSGSTSLVDSKSWQLAGEIYKTYLYCSARLIRSAGGMITSYDGDRVMGVFVGDYQTTPAAECALHINHAVEQIINPALAAQYPNANYSVRQVVGIDTSPLRAARTGVRGDNDIVWIGRAANYAAKLTALDRTQKSWVTAEAYNQMSDSVKNSVSTGEAMWSISAWTEFNGSYIYGSSWWRTP